MKSSFEGKAMYQYALTAFGYQMQVKVAKGDLIAEEIADEDIMRPQLKIIVEQKRHGDLAELIKERRLKRLRFRLNDKSAEYKTGKGGDDKNAGLVEFSKLEIGQAFIEPSGAGGFLAKWKSSESMFTPTKGDLSSTRYIRPTTRVIPLPVDNEK